MVDEQRIFARFSVSDVVNKAQLAAVFAAGLVVWIVLDYGLIGQIAKSTDLKTIIGVFAGASATLLGFLVSTGALLYAVANTQLVRNLQRTSHFQRLLADLFVDAAAFLMALVVALACLMLTVPQKGDSGPNWVEYGLGAMLFCNVAAYLLLVPLGHKMWLLLSSLRPPNPGTLE